MKDKRPVIKSLKDRLRNKFSVSVSEIGLQDNHRCSEISVAMAGTGRQYVNSALSSLINFFRFPPLVELIDYDLDLF